MDARVRFWQGFSIALGIALATAIGGPTLAQGRSQSPRFTEIDVERINIVEADGTVKLVIANRGRAPDQVRDGVARPRTDNNKSPGITFFDDAGDEAGGLKIRGDRREGNSARRHLLFDKHRGDQTLGFISDEDETGHMAGIMVWQRPNTPLSELAKRYEAYLAAPAGPTKDKAGAAFEALGGFGRQRAFAGMARNGDAIVWLADARGRERLRLIVTPAGDARIEFVDARGTVTRSFP
jgi:hypothetical protein